MLRPLFLLSDFGTCDCYVAQMKSAILSFCGPEAPVFDLTHEVGAGDIREGAFHLMTSIRWLPEDSVVLAVVDPGVGTGRRGIACRAGTRSAVGPDNGLLSWIGAEETRCLPAPDQPVSSTFHGRDWFAPCAARLLMDPGWMGFLEPCADPVAIPRGSSLRRGGSIFTTVARVDRFGNCVLWTSNDDLKGFSSGCVRIRDRTLRARRSDTYTPGGEDILVIAGSQGHAELAVAGGSAADVLGLVPGMEITMEEK